MNDRHSWKPMRFPDAPTIRSHAFVVALAVMACSGRDSAAKSASTDEHPDGGGNMTVSGKDAGTGHLHLTGDVTIDHDFLVDGCQIAPPGDGLLAGYHMNAKDGDSTLINLSVVVKHYEKDGPYSPSYNTEIAQVNEVMASGSQDFLTLMVARPPSPMPIAVMLKPESKLVVTISDEGARGAVKFSDMESPPSFEDIDMKSNTPPHGKRVSGTVTWACGTVEHIDATMDKAVNGMMNKLMPPSH